MNIKATIIEILSEGISMSPEETTTLYASEIELLEALVKDFAVSELKKLERSGTYSFRSTGMISNMEYIDKSEVTKRIKELEK